MTQARGIGTWLSRAALIAALTLVGASGSSRSAFAQQGPIHSEPIPDEQPAAPKTKLKPKPAKPPKSGGRFLQPGPDGVVRGDPVVEPGDPGYEWPMGEPPPKPRPKPQQPKPEAPVDAPPAVAPPEPAPQPSDPEPPIAVPEPAPPTPVPAPTKPAKPPKYVPPKPVLVPEPGDSLPAPVQPRPQPQPQPQAEPQRPVPPQPRPPQPAPQPSQEFIPPEAFPEPSAPRPQPQPKPQPQPQPQPERPQPQPAPSPGPLSGVIRTGLTDAAGREFTYFAPGDLPGSTGTGVRSATIFAPGMRYPIEAAPSFPNSQVYGRGGYLGPGGGLCDAANYAYPWRDNFCEKRDRSTPACATGKGHQGQDIRAMDCKNAVHWVVAVENGVVTKVGSFSVSLKGESGREYIYLHMRMRDLAVSQGQIVTRGQRLGKVSNDFGGAPTSIHLHFEIKANVALPGQPAGFRKVPPYASLVDAYKRQLQGTP